MHQTVPREVQTTCLSHRKRGAVRPGAPQNGWNQAVESTAPFRRCAEECLLARAGNLGHVGRARGGRQGA